MTTQQNKLTIGLADDHILAREGFAALIENFENCKVIFTAVDGTGVIENFKNSKIPDVMILDINMAPMNGYQTASWIIKNYPKVYVLILTAIESDFSLPRLLREGVHGFLGKDSHPAEFEKAILSARTSRHYYSPTMTDNLARLVKFNPDDHKANKAFLNERQIELLKQSCTTDTYKDIAKRMGITVRSVDALRDTLFAKLGVNSRVGLALYAVKIGIYHP